MVTDGTKKCVDGFVFVITDLECTVQRVLTVDMLIPVVYHYLPLTTKA